MSLYFIVTTTATVGYGDMSASTTLERIFCVLTMLAGVTSFTFISGALASILSNYDTSQA
jgi:voltage-gated potassium channel Kch